ncbi:MAG: tetratricopeptide repeat protein [Rhodospirillales bacterium]|nr:tetratricopeptide repeat protein [Rhodospirillales bacterium]MSP80911.1 tetratricopeptide repeat protein [Rhodospirillales bacterium]
MALASFGPSLAATETPKPGATTAGNYLAGRHAQAVRDMASAIAFYAAVLAREPDNPDLLRRAFVIYLAEGRIADALALAPRIPKDDSARIGYPEFLAAADAIKRGRFADAVTRLAALGPEGISAMVVPLLTAWAEAGRGDRPAAFAALGKLGGKEGTEPFRELHGALIADVAGDFAAAETAYRKIADEEGGPALRVAILLGNLHERTGERAKAQAVYDSFLKGSPDSRLLDEAMRRTAARERAPRPEVGTAAEGAAEAMLGLAGIFRQQNVRETGHLLVRLALHLRPDFPTAQVLLADMLESDRRYADANAVYEAIKPASPLHRATRTRIAANLNRMDQSDAAVARLESLAKREVKDAEPLIQLGDILRGLKKFKEAASAYDRAIERIGALERRHWPLLYSRAIALERSDQWPRAEADFLKALEFEPEQPYVLNYLGYSWVEKRQNLERATDMIRRAVALRPNDGYIVDSLGWVHYQLGDYPAAVGTLERAVELRPEDPVLNDHLGDAFWRVGRRTEARFQWERALGLKPEPDLIETIRKKLKEGLPDGPPAGSGG